VGTAAASTHAALADAAALALAHGAALRTVVLVEGHSDRAAVAALAERRGRDLQGEGTHIVPMGGATSIGMFLDLFGRQGLDVRLAGLCDAAEERDLRCGLERAGLGSALSRSDLRAFNFHVCGADLEEELIRSLGARAVEQVLEAKGELRLFRSFQNQPAQRERPHEAQLHRFMGIRSGRKIHYARRLVMALDSDRVPLSLDRLLARV
jgi:hypothetical protein